MRRKYVRRYENRNAWDGLTEKELRSHIEQFWSECVHYSRIVFELEEERFHLERRIARQRGMIRRLQQIIKDKEKPCS